MRLLRSWSACKITLPPRPPLPGLRAPLGGGARVKIRGDGVLEMGVPLKNHAAAAPAVAAAGAALGDVSLAMKGHAAFAAVPRARVNFYFVNKHGDWSIFFVG